MVDKKVFESLMQRAKEENPDLIPGIELTQWKAGRVLTEDDVKLLQLFLSETDKDIHDLMEQAEQSYKEALYAIGGEKLVKQVEALDTDMAERAVQHALKVYYENIRLRAEKAKASAN